ncbi:MAG TPA: copper-binding protein, partial [Rhodocyclaceae bacterium]
LLPAAAMAADGHEHHHGMAMEKAAQPAAQAAWVDGTVKKVDAAGGKLTLTHGPLDNLGMPAMTMAFRVKDKAWLGQIKEGDHIRFVADYVDGAVTVVRYEPAH